MNTIYIMDIIVIVRILHTMRIMRIMSMNGLTGGRGSHSSHLLKRSLDYTNKTRKRRRQTRRGPDAFQPSPYPAAFGQDLPHQRNLPAQLPCRRNQANRGVLDSESSSLKNHRPPSLPANLHCLIARSAATFLLTPSMRSLLSPSPFSFPFGCTSGDRWRIPRWWLRDGGGRGRRRGEEHLVYEAGLPQTDGAGKERGSGGEGVGGG